MKDLYILHCAMRSGAEFHISLINFFHGKSCYRKHKNTDRPRVFVNLYSIQFTYGLMQWADNKMLARWPKIEIQP